MDIQGDNKRLQAGEVRQAIPYLHRHWGQHCSPSPGSAFEIDRIC